MAEARRNAAEERPHSFPPSFAADARVLILGSMPGGESLRQQQYYAFRHNVFWRMMGEICSFSPALPYPERLAALRRSGIALWDVLARCERAGSLDSAIAHPEPNPIPELLRSCPKIGLILCNGSAAGRFFQRFFPETAIPVRVMPSTSPAAARMRYQEKLASYRAALEPWLL